MPDVLPFAVVSGDTMKPCTAADRSPSAVHHRHPSLLERNLARKGGRKITWYSLLMNARSSVSWSRSSYTESTYSCCAAGMHVTPLLKLPRSRPHGLPTWLRIWSSISETISSSYFSTSGEFCASHRIRRSVNPASGSSRSQHRDPRPPTHHLVRPQRAHALDILVEVLAVERLRHDPQPGPSVRRSVLLPPKPTN
jgi:hypothetical protein